MLRHSLKKQTGTAIIMALFVMSIVAVTSVAMISRFSLDVRRTTLLLNSNQAYLYAEGSILWARDQLLDNIKKQKPIDETPIQSALNSTHGFSIQSTIQDAEAYFNINNLASFSEKENYQQNFMKLLQTVNPTLDEASAAQLTKNIHDWITPFSKNGPETEYAQATPPYSASHRLMTSVSELRLVKGMTADLYQQLLPYLIALPETTPINVNTALPIVMMSLSPTLSIDGAKSIEAYRKEKPFLTTQQFSQFDIIRNNPISSAKITVKSDYFLVKTSVTVGEQKTILYSLLKRTMQQSKPVIIVLFETKGTL